MKLNSLLHAFCCTISASATSKEQTPSAIAVIAIQNINVPYLFIDIYEHALKSLYNAFPSTFLFFFAIAGFQQLLLGA